MSCVCICYHVMNLEVLVVSLNPKFLMEVHVMISMFWNGENRKSINL